MPDAPASHVSTILTTVSPFLTFALGFGASQWSEYQKEKRANKHDEITRREARILKRNEFQRTMLLALQDGLKEVFNETAPFIKQTQQQWRDRSEPSTNDDAVIGLRRVVMDVIRYQSRINDERVRSLTNEALDALLVLRDAENGVELQKAFDEVARTIGAASNVIGGRISAIDMEE